MVPNSSRLQFPPEGVAVVEAVYKTVASHSRLCFPEAWLQQPGFPLSPVHCWLTTCHAHHFPPCRAHGSCHHSFPLTQASIRGVGTTISGRDYETLLQRAPPELMRALEYSVEEVQALALKAWNRCAPACVAMEQRRRGSQQLWSGGAGCQNQITNGGFGGLSLYMFRRQCWIRLGYLGPPEAGGF